MMIRLTFACLFLFSAAASAQTSVRPQQAGEITSKALCTYITNRSDQTIMGTIETMDQRIASGDMVSHSDNFKLEAGKRRHFCASGPFFEGQRLKLILRTIIPLFECKTKIDKEIFLDATLDANGIKKLSATCY